MSSEKAVISAIILALLQIQVGGELFPDDDPMIKINADLSVKSMKDELRKTVRDGLEELNDLSFEYKLQGDVKRKEMMSHIEGKKSQMLGDIQTALIKGQFAGIDIGECNGKKAEEFEIILRVSTEEANSKLKQYYKSCEYQTISIDNVNRMKEEGVKVDEELKECIVETCFKDVTKASQELYTSASSKLKSILDDARIEFNLREIELMRSLNAISSGCLEQMRGITDIVVKCIDDKISQPKAV